MTEPREAVAPRAEDELRRLAETAREQAPAPWETVAVGPMIHGYDEGSAVPLFVGWASPDRILALLDRLGRLERLAAPFAFCDATDKREPCGLADCRNCSLRRALAPDQENGGTR